MILNINLQRFSSKKGVSSSKNGRDSEICKCWIYYR